MSLPLSLFPKFDERKVFDVSDHPSKITGPEDLDDWLSRTNTNAIVSYLVELIELVALVDFLHKFRWRMQCVQVACAPEQFYLVNLKSSSTKRPFSFPTGSVARKHD